VRETQAGERSNPFPGRQQTDLGRQASICSVPKVAGEKIPERMAAGSIASSRQNVLTICSHPENPAAETQVPRQNEQAPRCSTEQNGAEQKFRTQETQAGTQVVPGSAGGWQVYISELEQASRNHMKEASSISI